ncbi:unnamed protein product [Lactuca virosa]|uniref:AWS domain-containing protein n=1 Tax=Lactuca virosa TaxID=75947 RepID=A0AAU9NGF3_9ASTR|nr:unnamed protein product [Lactuca virosa]
MTIEQTLKSPVTDSGGAGFICRKNTSTTKSNLASLPANAAAWERTKLPTTRLTSLSLIPLRFRSTPAAGKFRNCIFKYAMPAMKKKTEPGDMRQLFERLTKEIGEPVEFELPDWLNKWKPNYTIIKRNIYLTKKVKKRVRVEDDGIFCSCTSTPGSSAACGRDCHCGMLLSSCSSNCKCDDSCLNKPFHRRPMKKMKIVQGLLLRKISCKESLLLNMWEKLLMTKHVRRGYGE